ncbi:MAG TPA: class I SAM-dependent DNA methyltransferase [Coleofasciculaceae cyanobacterium]
MDRALQNKIVSFIWSIADDCLRDVYVRGKYRDVILPMFVLRRLDCLLEDCKEAVLEEVRFQREEAGFTTLDPIALREASGYVFYNISDWTLTNLVKTATNNRQILEENFKAYLDGFSDNVKEIIEKFDLRSQIRRMVAADVLLEVLEKFTSPYINLSPHDATDPDGRKQPGLSNLGMGYVFEELIRKFNEENNEEAGEHFTPREVIKLMTHVLFIPVKDQLPPVITVYDGACGSGGMLTESQDFITDPEGEIGSKAAVYLYGKEVNGETYAICKSDMMIKGNDPENIKFGSTLSTDEFAGMKFDFMLSNPPYGKSYKSEQKFILDGAVLRFVPALREVMEWAYGKWGDRIYSELADHKTAIATHLEQEEIELNKKQQDTLFLVKTWETQRDLLEVGTKLMAEVGQALWMDYNEFLAKVEAALKKLSIKLSASEKNQLLNVVSWRDEAAAKVIKKVHNWSDDVLTDLLKSLDTSKEHLPDFGYWPGSKPGLWVEYEPDSELRDTENVPLKDQIHAYFGREVRPHVEDAWIALDKTQIGYEISFNKYFYQHKPLRSLEEVTAEILQLEQETEGLLKRLVSFGEGKNSSG